MIANSILLTCIPIKTFHNTFMAKKEYIIYNPSYHL